MVIYNNILGFPIDDINPIRTSTSSDVLSNDLFLMSQQVLSNVSPDRTYTSHENVYTNEYRSLNTSYSYLSDRIFNDVCALYGIRNMAWENSAEYSLANHIHNYSNVHISTFMTPKTVGQYSVDDRCYVNLSNIATFNVDSKNYTVSMPHMQLYDSPQPYIGQLKFLALTSFNDVNVDAENFDGWAYPNGQSLLISRFPHAYDVFGTAYGGDDTHFNLPNINNFLKPIAVNFANDLRQVVPYKVPLVSHKHQISKTNINLQVDLYIQYLAVGNTDAGEACHGSSQSTPDRKDTHDIGFIFKNFQIQNPGCIKESGQAMQYESYPAFNYIPVMIYIGKPNGN